ncbi:MAG: RNA polymerase sigma factor CarQ [Bacteroidia bacterium]|nr:RNA polymerase sigma factor CarQ [Bacteroidia bacterium]
MQSHQTDEQLIKGYLNGNDNCFEQLLKRHKNKIFTYIVLTVKQRDVAEDIFQEVFLKVINTMNKGTYKEEGKFLPWVMRIAHNMVMDYFRNGKKIQFVDNADDEDEESLDIFKLLESDEKNAEEKILDEEMEQEVRIMINRLDDEQKEVLLMRHYGKMSFKEIAKMTNVNINTALGRMRYAILNLRSMMSEKKEKRIAA